MQFEENQSHRSLGSFFEESRGRIRAFLFISALPAGLSPNASSSVSSADKTSTASGKSAVVACTTGLSADTGEVLGVALKAQVTVTYGWPKIGQILPPGRDYVGRLWQVDISIPPDLAQEVPRGTGRGRGTCGRLLPAGLLAAIKAPRPPAGPVRLRGQDRGRGPGGPRRPCGPGPDW